LPGRAAEAIVLFFEALVVSALCLVPQGTRALGLEVLATGVVGWLFPVSMQLLGRVEMETQHLPFRRRVVMMQVATLPVIAGGVSIAAAGTTVLIHGRDAEKLASTAHELRSSTGSDRIKTYLADFSSLQSVRAMATEVEAENHRLHVLVNNAGVGSGKPAGTTRQES